jgi:glycerol-3-phosphate acyltransferase PlsY
VTGVFVTALIVSYFLGAIPFGYIVGRMRGVDIRAVGSGNIGATNVWRILGPKAGSIVFALDVLKGFAATEGTELIIGSTLPSHEHRVLIALCAVVVVLGHTFSVFLKFKGGKGIATAFGAMLGMVPVVAISCFALWGVVLYFSRIISIASIAACASTPIFLSLAKSPAEYGIVVIILAMIGLLKHLPNMQRLIAGTEPKMGVAKPVVTEEAAVSGLADGASRN